jgi:hypothetical protein
LIEFSTNQGDLKYQINLVEVRRWREGGTIFEPSNRLSMTGIRVVNRSESMQNLDARQFASIPRMYEFPIFYLKQAT